MEGGWKRGAQDGEESAYATVCNRAAAVQQRRREEEVQSLEGPQLLHPHGLSPPPTPPPPRGGGGGGGGGLFGHTAVMKPG